MYVLPLTTSQINWLCVKAISDRLKMPYPLALGADKDILSEMCYTGGVVRDGRTVWQLDNFFISFYVEAEDILPLLGRVSLFTVQQGAYVLNGSISSWRDLLIDGLRYDNTTEARQVLGFIFSYIKDAGFASLFDKYQRVPCEDGTFILRG